MLPSVSHATSVGWRNCPLTGGRGGVTRVQCSVSSDASFFRPNTIVTCPAGLKRTIMSEPLSTAQRLSSLSNRTVCAYDHAYSPLPTSRRYFPVLSKRRTCEAVAPYAGPPALFDRVYTAISPFELTATPDASPRFMSAGSLRKLMSASNGISGTCCASAVDANSRKTATSGRRTRDAPFFQCRVVMTGRQHMVRIDADHEVVHVSVHRAEPVRDARRNHDGIAGRDLARLAVADRRTRRARADEHFRDLAVGRHRR